MEHIKIYLPAFVSFVITVILCKQLIPVLHKMKFGQQVRDDGPESHLQKQGTPTMGGIIFLPALVMTLLFFLNRNLSGIVPVLILTLGFGFVGFLDDYIKLVKKRSLGLRAWQKLFLQILVTVVFYYFMTAGNEEASKILIPFAGKTLDLGVLFLPFVFIAVLGTVNGANFTDGIDGLASNVTVLIAGFFVFASQALIGNPNAGGVFHISIIMIGILLGFLLFNTYPAKVFMGDTGSLALGGFVAGAAFMLNIPLFIIIVAFVYLAEILSVMIQVSYFKISKGKRIFKMAPIHHHFELSGFAETVVVVLFSVITLFLCVVGYGALF